MILLEKVTLFTNVILQRPSFDASCQRVQHAALFGPIFSVHHLLPNNISQNHKNVVPQSGRWDNLMPDLHQMHGTMELIYLSVVV